MVKLIHKSGYVKPAGAGKYMKYIATRDGVEKNKAPDNSIYMRYIATRPGAERITSHGLFGPRAGVNLDEAMDEVSHHTGKVWTFIYSLQRSDAKRIGYDHGASWRSLLVRHQVDLAKALNVDPTHLRWYAAFHDEGNHPHIHLMCWSTDPKEGRITKSGIENMRSALTNDIFHDEMLTLYQEKDAAYHELVKEARERIASVTNQMQSGCYEDPEIEKEMSALAGVLAHTKGRHVYGYLPQETKARVDKIISLLEQQPQVSACYAAWNELKDKLDGYYHNDPREHNPLADQEEFRAIKNIVIREADLMRSANNALGELPVSDEFRQAVEQLRAATSPEEAAYAMDQVRQAAASGDPYARFVVEHSHSNSDIATILVVTKLVCSIGNLFRGTPPPAHPGGVRVESKRRRRIKEKKLAHGQKADDHEPVVNGNIRESMYN